MYSNDTGFTGFFNLGYLSLHRFVDLEALEFEIPGHLDVGDDVHVCTVRKVEFLPVRELHLEPVTGKLQKNLKQNTRLLLFNKQPVTVEVVYRSKYHRDAKKENKYLCDYDDYHFILKK